MRLSPVFICGPSRSGTSLMQASLELTGSVSIAGETHYFDNLRVELGGAATKAIVSEDLRLKVEDYFLSLTHRPFGHNGSPAMGWMNRQSLRNKATEYGDTPDAYFRAFCELWAARTGASIWGEKTPRHAFRIKEIVKCFPNAKILFMLRDPRAVVASYRDWKNHGGFDFEKDPGHREALAEEELRASKSYHPLIVALLWRAALRSVKTALRAFGGDRIRLVHYERLCEQPDIELKLIYDWIKVDAIPDTAAVPVRNSSYDRFSSKGGFQTSASTRWQATLSVHEIRLVQFIVGSELADSGYARLKLEGDWIRTLLLLCSSVPAAIGAARANTGRSGNLTLYILRRLSALL